jgi:hypothetical protein
MKPHSSWDGFGFRIYIFCSGVIFLLRIKVIGDSLFFAVGPIIELVSILDSCLALFYSFRGPSFASTAYAVTRPLAMSGFEIIPTCINIKDLFVVGNDIYYVSIAVL